MGLQATAPEAEKGPMKSKSKRTEVAGGERGRGGGGSGTPAALSQMGVFLEQNICARPSVSMHSVHFSCPLPVSFSLKPSWGENSVSVQYKGYGLGLTGPGGREGQNFPGFTQMLPAPASRNKGLSPQPHDD